MIIIFVLLVSVLCVKGNINRDGPTVTMDLTNCMDHIIEKNFNAIGSIIFANSKNVSTSVFNIRNELLTRIHARMKYPVEIMYPDNEMNICDFYDEKLGILHVDNFQTKPSAAYFIIILDKFTDFPYLTNKILRSRSWNPSAKFIILLLNFSAVKYIKYVEEMLSCLFKYNAIDAMVLMPEPNKIRNAIVYSWKPFDPPKYCGHYNETAHKRVYVDNKCVKGRLTLDHLKTIQIPNDMKGCALHMIALERQPFVSDKDLYANIERRLINELVKRYNFKPTYEIINTIRGERIDSHWTGALKELAFKRGQILLGGIYPDDEVHEDFECSVGYLENSYIWVVPKASQRPPWRALSGIFQRCVWYCIMAGFIVGAISWRILGQLSRDTAYNKSLHHCFLNSWICSLGYCAYLRPKTQSLRLFFCFFSLYCTIIITAYQTKLIDVLKNPADEYQIKHVKELVESGLDFGGFKEMLDLFSDPSDPLDHFITKNWINVVDNERAMLDVAVHRNFSVLCSSIEVEHISAVTPELSDNFGNYRYYAFEESTFSVPVEMVALRGYAFMKKFSKTIGAFKQYGINDAIMRNLTFMNQHRRENFLRKILEEKSEVNALSLRHLESGFIFLTFGYVSGTIMFFLEIIVNTKFVKHKMVEIKRKCYHIKAKII